jgi:glutathione synthase/RimK-type ligase-like ATP-grasp enzyme
LILVISHPADLHATRVLERLAARGAEAFLLDLADLPNEATLTIEYEDPRRPTARLRHRTSGTVELMQATAVWWRRPQYPSLEAVTDPDGRGFAHGEWHEALYGLYHLLDCPWMNPVLLDDAASKKPLQLQMAAAVGLRVPETLMTSDPDEARRFVARRGMDQTIFKIFAATTKVWRETRPVRPADLAQFDAIRLAPVIFQELVPAVADLRITIVGDDLFPMAIDSRGTSYELDFRLSLAEASTTATQLPPEVAEKLLTLMRAFGLPYGAVDMRLTPEGDYVFLEVNPGGEFLFSEAGTGFPITEAVANWLLDPRPRDAPAR